jgi:hypothetical protein
MVTVKKTSNRLILPAASRVVASSLCAIPQLQQNVHHFFPSHFRAVTPLLNGKKQNAGCLNEANLCHHVARHARGTGTVDHRAVREAGSQLHRPADS